MKSVLNVLIVFKGHYTFIVINNRYIITHGFTKKTQKTPKREIIHAKQIRREFEEEYYANN